MANALLDYSFQPPQVFADKAINLNLVITNKTGDTIEFEGGPDGDEIHIIFPVGRKDTDLVTELGFTSDSLTSGFTCKQDGTYYVVRATSGVKKITPGMQIQFKFNQVKINSTIGTATIPIEEFISVDGDQPSGTTSCDVTKKAADGLDVIVWLQPMTVGLDQMADLNWVSTGATSIKVSGFFVGLPTQDFPVTGDGFNSTPVGVKSNEAQRTYTVQAFATGVPPKSQPATLTQSPPIITEYSSNKTGTVGVTDKVVLEWECLFYDSVSIKPPGRAISNPPKLKEVTPGMDVLRANEGNYANLPATANYRLTAFGYESDPFQDLTFKLAPVGLAYFKFLNKGADGTLSGATWNTNPSEWTATSADLSKDPFVLTVFQPGGKKDLYYLGSADKVHPQIQYFNAEKGTGDQYTLSWVTANLKSLVLNPGNYQITGADIVNGSKSLTLAAAQYTLTGTGTDDSTIVSILNVPFQPRAGAFEEAVEMEQRNDPNCIINVAATGPLRNYPKVPPNATQMSDARGVIAKLNFADIWRKPPFSITQGTVRLDIQGGIANGGRNIQVQLNGASGDSTISGTTVQGNVGTASTAARQDYVQRMVRNALANSLNDRQFYDVNGPCR